MAKNNSPRSIIIQRALQLGDLLCAVPAFRALRRAYPNAQITLVGLPWAREFVGRFNAYFDDFIEFPGWPGLPETPVQADRIPGFLREVQSRQYDLAIQMQGSGGITNPLVSLYGARTTAGYYLTGQFCPNPDTFLVYPEGEREVRIHLLLMAFLGIAAPGEHLEFPLTEEEKANYNRFCAQNNLEPGSFVCIHPGARAAERQWAAEKFAEVGDALSQMGYQVVITGSKEESAITRAVAQKMRARPLDLTAKTDLATVAQLLQNARLLVSNDTGVVHIANAVQAPSVVVYTVDESDRWRPLNHNLHRAVYHANEAGAEEVLAEAHVLLREVERDAEPG